MDFNVEVRLKQLKSLDQFISSSRDKVNSILNAIDWTEEKVLKDVSMIKCSVNSSHRVPVNSIDKHIEKCSLKSEGYLPEEQFLSEPVNNSISSIMIDDFEKMKIIADARNKEPEFITGWNGQDPAPKTADRNIVTYSSDERLAFYDYSIKRTKGPPELPEFNVYSKPSVKNRSLTYEEKLAHIRDAKRRRIKYRSVHTNHKNHTEIMREVIESQMELYKEWLLDGKTPKDYDGKNSLQHSDKLKELDELSDKSSNHHSLVRSKSRCHSITSKGASNHTSKNDDSCERRERKSRRDRDYSRDRHRSRRSDSGRSHRRERRHSRDYSRDRSHHRKRYS